MADSHKDNADGRPVIYGEPELVYAFAMLVKRTVHHRWLSQAGQGTAGLLSDLLLFLRYPDEAPVLLEEADFAAIEAAALGAQANIAIGHSGGKSLHRTPRYSRWSGWGFPIHDRTGGQRILSAGYRGTLAFLDRFTNTLLETKYATYRQKIKEELSITEGV